MSVNLFKFVRESRLEPNKRYVLLMIADRCDDDGRGFFKSMATLADDTGYSERQVQRTVKELCDDGILERHGVSKWGTVVYWINLHKLSAYHSTALEQEENPEEAPQQEGVTICHPLEKEGGDMPGVGGDICDSEGVTFETERGDKMSPNTSLRQILNTSIKDDSGDKMSPPFLLRKAWAYAREQLRASMARTAFVSLVEPLELDPHSDELCMLIRSPDPALSQSRLGKTIVNLITPNFIEPIEVQFIDASENGGEA